jgi:dipeptidyl aminopeptidase/acylaminoacyl peptidase
MTNHTLISDIPYKSGTDLSPYEQSRCKLDLFLPKNPAFKNFPTVLWLHGGGLQWGQKEDPTHTGIADNLAAHGIALASANYRLYPQAKYPAYLHDAAHAFLWLRQNISKYNGSPDRLIVSGHSAGAYLAAMLVMAPDTLAHVGLTPEHIKAACPISGQVVTHITVRTERNVPNPGTTPVIDTDAPIYHIRPNTPPMLYIIGDADWPGRYEETLYFVTMLGVVGNKVTQLLKVPNRDHGSIANEMVNPQDPAMQAYLSFIQQHA